MKKCMIIMILVCFAFMLAGPSSLMAGNDKIAKPNPPKSKISTAVNKNHKMPAEAVLPLFRLNLPWLPVIIPFNPGIPNGDDNRLESSTNPNVNPGITDRVIGGGDDEGWEDHDK